MFFSLNFFCVLARYLVCCTCLTSWSKKVLEQQLVVVCNVRTADWLWFYLREESSRCWTDVEEKRKDVSVLNFFFLLLFFPPLSLFCALLFICASSSPLWNPPKFSHPISWQLPPPPLSLLLYHPSFPFWLALQWGAAAGARRLPVCPQHQQRGCVGPNQLLQRGSPQHVPRRPAAGRTGPAGLHLHRRPGLPVSVTRQQPGPQDARGDRDFQQVHIQVCTQVSSRKPGENKGASV